MSHATTENPEPSFDPHLQEEHAKYFTFFNVAMAMILITATLMIAFGSVRFGLFSLIPNLWPILLTAGAAMLGAWVITLDPIFSGLAVSLIFGLLVSTVLTLVVIPAVYLVVPSRVRAEEPLSDSEGTP